MRGIFRIALTGMLLSPLGAVQRIADQTLNQQEQTLAAGIIAQPDLLESYLSDDRPAMQGFVERYREWGARAARTCRG